LTEQEVSERHSLPRRSETGLAQHLRYACVCTCHLCVRFHFRCVSSRGSILGSRSAPPENHTPTY